ncbi:TadE family protein [uncultured Porticoccus sp.]|uniref:TadE/TadG family type IV pilus assembly protein n=1 Tax=uncultured Porticoccus sp. TaxID=1256050 RepID=UPI002610A59C|nr:TadE family protein [uncultured Porticoccus sp.]
MATKTISARRRKNRGSATIEFILVFIIIFLLFYGMVGYTLPILLSATYQEIASEGLREAVDLHFVAEHDSEIDIPGYVRQLVEHSWIPSNWVETCSGFNESFLNRQEGIWRVCLRHSNPESIIPPLRFFDWQIPTLPNEIRGEAVIRIH